MIRSFRIINEDFNEFLGMLYYNTETEECRIDFLDSYEGLHPDIYIYELAVRKGLKHVEGEMADKYVNARVMPPNRQALRQYLNDMGLEEYSVWGIIDFFKGRCPMDSNYFEEIF